MLMLTNKTLVMASKPREKHVKLLLSLNQKDCIGIMILFLLELLELRLSKRVEPS